MSDPKNVRRLAQVDRKGRNAYVNATQHQFIERHTGRVCDEPLYADRWIRCLYSPAMERSGALFRGLTSRRWSRLVATWNYDSFLGQCIAGGGAFLTRMGVDLSECLDDPDAFETLRQVFERKIRYWERRPLPEETDAVVAPSDARVLLGSLRESSYLYLKEKFFDLGELLGNVERWAERFRGGDAAIFRLTPEKYHYNHSPVSGTVADIYRVDGGFHSCNPSAIVSIITPYSKNARVVTVIDSDVPGGTGLGLVGMIEVAAMMIGDIAQCYSANLYDDPRDVAPGQWLERGQPKSLFRPGASTVVLLFEPGRVAFASDLTKNQQRPVRSRFSAGFGRSLTETDIAVRSLLARPAGVELRFPLGEVS
jgi:phosphatidylserine decarboxylase